MKKTSEYCSAEFNKYLENYGYAVRKPRTFEEYVNHINLLCNYLCMDFLDIDSSDAMQYYSYMMSRFHAGTLSRKTICARISCYKSVASYINEVKDGYQNPFIALRRPEKSDDTLNPKRIPTLSELDEFMSVVKEDPMFFLIYALATRVGLSASSILRIKITDIIKEDYGDGKSITFIRFPGSGHNEDRFVALPKDVAEILGRYLSIVVPVDGKIFLNRHNHPMTLKNLDTATTKFFVAAGIKNKYTMKDLRSRAILELAKAGADLESIRDYTGLSYMRINTLISSKSLVDRKCPADLVNYELKTS